MDDVPMTLYDDVQVTLTNDGRFYRWCLIRFSPRSKIMITQQHWKNAIKHFYAPAGQLSSEESVALRRYFYERWIKPDRIPDRPNAATLTATVVPTPPPEIPVMSTKLTFKPVFLLNGVDVTKLPKDEIYASISAEEQRLDKLREIKHQPNSLIAEIEAGEEALKALVEHLDAN